MPADHERARDPHETAPRRSDRAGAPAGDDADGIGRAAVTVRHGIDQVADKVKGLLRSDR